MSFFKEPLTSHPILLLSRISIPACPSCFPVVSPQPGHKSVLVVLVLVVRLRQSVAPQHIRMDRNVVVVVVVVVVVLVVVLQNRVRLSDPNFG